jgi:2-dehydro-3-deoxygalactonokinase
MTESCLSYAVALDGGTTNTRARLIRRADQSIAATARRNVGVRDTVLLEPTGAGGGPLERAVREALEEVVHAAGGVRPEVIVAAGMLSAEVGLTTVPHVAAPAGLAELAAGTVARRLPAVAPEPILFVPGVRSPAAGGPDGWAEADVMRGEECETLGAWTQLAPAAGTPTAFLWPGSHSKLVLVDPAGRIVRSHTTLSGELMQALARHTLLAASLPSSFPDEPDPEALAAGVRLAERDGLGRAAFLVRLAALTETLDPDRRSAFWMGAVVADDAAHLARHSILQARPPLWVGGRQPLRTLYTTLLGQRCEAPVLALDAALAEAASALGALAVVQRQGARAPDRITPDPITG